MKFNMFFSQILTSGAILYIDHRENLISSEKLNFHIEAFLMTDYHRKCTGILMKGTIQHYISNMIIICKFMTAL